MRSRNSIVFSTLAIFIASLALGCQGTEVPITPAPASTPAPSQELPKETKKGGGPSSSGNLKRNPGLDPLSK